MKNEKKINLTSQNTTYFVHITYPGLRILQASQMQLGQLRPIKLSLQSTDNSVNDLTFTRPVTVSRCTMRRFGFGWVSSHVTVFPQAAG